MALNDWLLALNMLSSLIHVVISTSVPSLLMAKYCSIVRIDLDHKCLSNYQRMDVWGCFDITSNVAMKIHVQVFTWTYIFISLGHIPRSENSGSMRTPCLIFWETAKLSKAVASLYIPTSMGIPTSVLDSHDFENKLSIQAMNCYIPGFSTHPPAYTWERSCFGLFIKKKKSPLGRMPYV